MQLVQRSQCLVFGVKGGTPLNKPYESAIARYAICRSLCGQ
ncbi:hypothetical protein QT972_06875 [Microcoleus sp. herbarium7]